MVSEHREDSAAVDASRNETQLREQRLLALVVMVLRHSHHPFTSWTVAPSWNASTTLKALGSTAMRNNCWS